MVLGNPCKRFIRLPKGGEPLIQMVNKFLTLQDHISFKTVTTKAEFVTLRKQVGLLWIHLAASQETLVEDRAGA